MKFSDFEKQELLKVWIVISFAFAVLNSSMFSFTFIIYFLISMFTVGIGILLHEIAHKYVAQKYGCSAEFRANDQMLLFSVILAVLFRGFFAAPGGVWIHGHITKEKNGKISLAGPVANIFLALLFLGISFLPLPIFIGNIADYGFTINAFIAMFNMIPVANFDGKKILDWSKLAYVLTVLFSAFLVFLPDILAALNA